MDFGLGALNVKTVGAVLLLGVAPLLFTAGVLAVMGQGRANTWVVGSVLLLAALLGGLGIWQLASVRVHVTPDSLTVGGGVYRLSVPLDRLEPSRAGLRNPADPMHALGLRTNGIGMPGLALGWFNARGGGGRVFAAITNPDDVVVIPTDAGYTVMVSPQDPRAFLAALSSR